MAYFSLQNFSIKGVSAVVPPKVVSNYNYQRITEENRKKFIKTTGVEERRCVDDKTTTSDLCYQAAEPLLEALGWKRDEVELLVFVSQMRDYVYPCTATILQDRLNLPKSCLAFDVPLGCSGYVYGLSIVGSMLQASGIKKALLLAGEAGTPELNYKDQSTYPLFGDAGTATAIEWDENAAPMYFDLNSDGSGYEAIIMRHGARRHPLNEDSFIEREFGPGIIHSDAQVSLDGMRVFEFTMREVADNIKNVVEQSGHNIADVDYFVLHQANKLMNETVRKVLKVDPAKVPYSIAKFGNTSSATVPLTMVTEMSKVLGKEKLKLLMSGFGIGLSWGSVFWESNPFKCLPLMEYKTR